MSITTVTEKEQQLAQALTSANKVIDNAIARINEIEREFQELRALVGNVHRAKGWYHSQLAMAALYEACDLPNVKPVSGEKA